MTPFPDPLDFQEDLISLTGDRAVTVRDFSVPVGPLRCLQWDISWIGARGTAEAYRLQISGAHLESAVWAKGLVLGYLREGLSDPL